MADLEIIIGDQKIEVTDPEQVPVTIDYALEDQENFQNKKSGQAIGVNIPATLMNSAIGNSFHNPSVEDLSAGEAFRNPQKLVVKARGMEIMTGKALLQDASHTDVPEDYTWNFFGDNADWMLDLINTTIYDLLQNINFIFTKAGIIASWQFDGTNENLPYVFAPVRYSSAMGNPDSLGIYDDYNMLPEYMKPSISKYFIIYWAFKSLGYKIQSTFLDLPYFRRQTMPWTWGAFLYSDGTRLDNLRFLAKSTEDTFINATFTGVWDLKVTNETTLGAFDNSNVYNYNKDTYAMEWTYPAQFNYGNLDAYLGLSIYIDAVATDDGDNHMWILWKKISASSGATEDLGTDDVFKIDGSTRLGKRTFSDLVNLEKKVNINPGDIVTAQVFIRNYDPAPLVNFGRANITANIESFTLSYFRIPLGTGTIDFKNFTSFKNYLFLDYLRGIVDEFNLSFKTDATNKVILIEPTHPYQLPGEAAFRPGYFNGDFVDWSGKLDLSKKGLFTLFSNYNQQVNFRYKPDGNDSMQKTISDRYQVVLAQARYQLPARFQVGNKDFENRFFSSLIHFDAKQWIGITGIAPQMIALVSQNSTNNAPNTESQSTLLPKSAYYKGVVQGLGWVFDGDQQSAFPMMFGVNYMPGGENDPVLSYTDEKCGNDSVGYQVGQGLLKKFFLQRMANIRNGQWHTIFMKLNNFDVAIPWHREFKAYMNQRWELITIEQYNPMTDESTKCTLRKWVPISQSDSDSIFPSPQSLLNNSLAGLNDIKYIGLKCLISDIPK